MLIFQNNPSLWCSHGDKMVTLTQLSTKLLETPWYPLWFSTCTTPASNFWCTGACVLDIAFLTADSALAAKWLPTLPRLNLTKIFTPAPAITSTTSTQPSSTRCLSLSCLASACLSSSRLPLAPFLSFTSLRNRCFTGATNSLPCTMNVLTTQCLPSLSTLPSSSYPTVTGWLVASNSFLTNTWYL